MQTVKNVKVQDIRWYGMTKTICQHEVNVYVLDGILKVLVYNVYCQDGERLDPLFDEPDHQLTLDMSNEDPIVKELIGYLLETPNYAFHDAEYWEEHDDWFDIEFLLEGPPMLADWADGIPKDY